MKKDSTDPVAEGREVTPLEDELQQRRRFVGDPIYRELAAELDFQLREDESLPSREQVKGL